MEITLHLGAHRTATTTFQRFLAANHLALGEAGVVAWTPDQTRDGRLDGLIGQPARQDDPARARERLHRRLARLEGSGCRRLLVSEENMMGSARNNLRAGQLYGDLGPRLARLAPAFGPRVTRVALTIRSYDAYWSSALAFAALRGHPAPDAASLQRLVEQPVTWRDVIRIAARAFPDAEVTVLRYDDMAGSPGRQAGLLCPELTLPRTLPGASDWCNPAPRGTRLRHALIAQGAAPDLLPQGESRWMPFTPLQRAAFQAVWRADLDWLASGAEGLARPATPISDTGTKLRRIRINRTPAHFGGHAHDQRYATL